jgi:hypothetical protein
MPKKDSRRIKYNVRHSQHTKGGLKMIAQEKIEAIRKYLKSEFPDYEIDDTDDFERVLEVECVKRFNNSRNEVRKAFP